MRSNRVKGATYIMKVIFLDRDGVINDDIGYLHRIEDFIFIDGVFDTCRYFLQKNYHIIVITNQSGIARGYYQQRDFEQVNEWMLNQFQQENIKILETFFCPHQDSDYCFCRKPKPGMLLEAKDKYAIDMSQSWLIGDKDDDISAANNAGIRQTILVKSGQTINVANSNASFILKSIKESTAYIQ